ncbi:hypothetical protein EGR_04924 [Echinococcus granulosus]|uniref:Uncharacterized protein n=1 Tax=Echinococcus granulosus TaxID=6210 RepID=W6V2N2_ECHGR|nr:hypothetical protein EGR_04924 [Echinococcus granulosus]EUB60214.1 hypothetical protein EGR_04924 [Echinococcus granulosus]
MSVGFITSRCKCKQLETIEKQIHLITYLENLAERLTFLQKLEEMETKVTRARAMVFAHENKSFLLGRICNLEKIHSSSDGKNLRFHPVILRNVIKTRLGIGELYEKAADLWRSGKKKKKDVLKEMPCFSLIYPALDLFCQFAFLLNKLRLKKI